VGRGEVEEEAFDARRIPYRWSGTACTENGGLKGIGGAGGGMLGEWGWSIWIWRQVFAVFVVYPGDIVGYVGIYGFGILCTHLSMRILFAMN